MLRAVFITLVLLSQIPTPSKRVEPRPDKGKSQSTEQQTTAQPAPSPTPPIGAVNQQPPSNQPSNQGSNSPKWWGPETAPEWIQCFLTVMAGLVAWLAFRYERAAVILTERADVLISNVLYSTTAPDGFILPNTVIGLNMKNTGRTRANNIKCVIGMFIEGRGDGITNRDVTPIVLGAGESWPTSWAEFGQMFPEEAFHGVISGTLKLMIDGSIDYEDVFGKPHITKVSGQYSRITKSFVLTNYSAS